LDRRYKQARAYDGTPASQGKSRRQEAFARAKLAQARVGARSARGGGNEEGPKSIDPYAAVEILRARAAEKAVAGRIFQEEGSGVYGAQPAVEDALRRDEDQYPLLPSR
jgi:hypothetical protein